MIYDLTAIESTCLRYGLSCSCVGESELEVSISPDAVLVFANTVDPTDTYLGFRDVPWHSHGKLLLMTGDSTYLEYAPEELIEALMAGKVLIVTLFFRGQIKDRWLAHRDERLDVGSIKPDEELRVYQIVSNV